MEKHKCIKCKYEWQPRVETQPKECPQCKSYYWHNYPIGIFIDWVRNEEIKEVGFNLLRLWGRDIFSMKLNEFELLIGQT